MDLRKGDLYCACGDNVAEMVEHMEPFIACLLACLIRLISLFKHVLILLSIWATALLITKYMLHKI